MRQLILLPLLPIFVVAATSDLQHWLSPAGDESRAVIIGLIGILIVAFTLPCWLRWCWPTRPLEMGASRSLMEATLSGAGVEVTEILRWDTGGRTANAAMSGFLPRLRYLFVTDALLERLGPGELRAITAHEAAHCRLGHFPRLVVSLLIPFLALLLADQLTAQSTWLGPARTPILVLIVLGLWGTWHGRWARLLEHQADVVACRLTSAGEAIDADAVRCFERALAATGGRLEGDWLHPPPTARVRLLQDLVANPIAEASFGRSVQMVYWVQWLVIILLATACFGGA